jgi:hypothetical protein
MAHVEDLRIDLGVLLGTHPLSPEEIKARRMAERESTISELARETPRNMLLIPAKALEKWLDEEAKK